MPTCNATLKMCFITTLLTCTCILISHVPALDDGTRDTRDGRNRNIPSTLKNLQWRPSQYFQSLDAQRAASAISAGSMEPLESLHKKGFDWNTKGQDGVTLLLWAFLADEFEIFNQLLKWGADPDMPLDPEKDLLLYHDCREFSTGDSVTMVAAVVPRRSKWLLAAISHGGNPNSVGSISGETVFTAYLDHALPMGNHRFETLDLMIERGANIHHRNNYGEGALIKAFLNNDWDVMANFLVLGVKPVCYDRRDWQLVHHVAAMEHERRQDNEQFPEKKQEWLNSPLRKDFERLVELLAERGFPLEEAIADVKRANESVNGIPYMTWRRMQREDKDACSEPPAVNGADKAANAPRKPAPQEDR